ncbi:MAG TPA: hypothetical protein VFA20_08510 [Myxococcaceae bacterium]|nr:hypothetical protein [Myxococcaceae bacterium]
MSPDDHQAFLRALVERVAGDPRVVGVVALGSSSDPAAVDAWSDHDLFLVVAPGAQEAFRNDLSWLAPGKVLHAFRETAHGVTAILEGGHLVELAVFDPEELAVARVSRYRVLFDRGGIAGRMEAVARASEGARGESGADDAWLTGMFLSGVLVGGGRARRGERLAGRAALAGAARRLMVLIARHVPGAGGLDPFDPHRRFERAYPSIGAEIDQALSRGGPEGALLLLAIAERATSLIPRDAAAAIRARLTA